MAGAPAVHGVQAAFFPAWDLGNSTCPMRFNGKAMWVCLKFGYPSSNWLPWSFRWKRSFLGRFWRWTLPPRNILTLKWRYITSSRIKQFQKPILIHWTCSHFWGCYTPHICTWFCLQILDLHLVHRFIGSSEQSQMPVGFIHRFNHSIPMFWWLNQVKSAFWQGKFHGFGGSTWINMVPLGRHWAFPRLQTHCLA